MRTTLTTLLALAVAASALLAGSAQAATITFLGEDSTTGSNWRTTSVSKSSTFDPNGDNVYGSDGYYFGGSAITGGAGGTPTPTVYTSAPSYIATIAPSGAFYVSNAYLDFDDPTAAVGSAVNDINGGLYYNAGTKFSFDVSADTEFVVAVLIGGSVSTNSSPTGISISQTAGTGSGTASATSIPALAIGEYVFFGIDAAAGDSFDVDIDATNKQGIVGLGFEAVPAPVPEPGSLAILVAGGLSSALLLRRQRR